MMGPTGNAGRRIGCKHEATELTEIGKAGLFSQKTSQALCLWEHSNPSESSTLLCPGTGTLRQSSGCGRPRPLQCWPAFARRNCTKEHQATKLTKEIEQWSAGVPESVGAPGCIIV